MMYSLPTRIIFGTNAVEQGLPYLSRLGKHALIVTGKSSAAASGALADVVNALEVNGIHYTLFDQVEQNPSFTTVEAGAEVFRTNSCDFVIGIGGGSPIDAAKAISVAAANHLQGTNIANVSLFKHAYPILAVPTTSGTGTEATQYSVLTDTSIPKKAGFGHDLIFPVLALADPRYTLSLNRETTLYTAIDALSHLLEGIYSNKRNPLLYPIIYKGVELIIRHLPALLDNLNDIEARTFLMQASLYGGITIAHTSTTFQHSIGYPLTTVQDLPHGLANGVVMQQVMDLYEPHIKPELDALFAYLNMDKAAFIAWLQALHMQMPAPLAPGFADKYAEEVLASRNMANNPYPVTREDIDRIYASLSSPAVIEL